MKFYSTKIEKLYDSEEELQKAEADFDKENADKVQSQKDIFEIAKKISQDNKILKAKLNEYCDKYGELELEDADDDVKKLFTDLFVRPRSLFDFFG